MRFVDTNILLYGASVLPEDAEKRSQALSVLAEPDLALSVQVLQEFYHQATRPTRSARLSDDEALRFLEPLLGLHVQPLTLDLFRRAVAIAQRYRVSYWDGAILAAAGAAGCDVVYSEDLSAHQRYDNVQVLNPFAL